MKEPQTDDEFEAALKRLQAKVIDHGDTFSVEYTGTDGRNQSTRLEAEDYSNALFEAWSLLKE